MFDMLSLNSFLEIYKVDTNLICTNASGSFRKSMKLYHLLIGPLSVPWEMH